MYYAYGIHNGFGLDFDPIKGCLWDTETGHIINDEVNLLMTRFNIGYEITHGVSFPTAPYAMVNFNGIGIYSNPEFVWVQKAVPTPTGLKFLTSNIIGSNTKMIYLEEYLMIGN